jgi:DNA-binding transcriptional ArsR family regulator
MICSECMEKEQPKVEPEIMGKSESKPLLEDLNRINESEDVMAEDELFDEDDIRSKECTVCGEIKDFEYFDSSDKICEECIEEQNRLESIKKHVGKVDKPVKKAELKECTKCNEDKPLSEYYFNKRGPTDKKYPESICKKFKGLQAKERNEKLKKQELNENKRKTQANESMEKRALELFGDNQRWFNKKKISVEAASKKLGYAKSTITQHLDILVEKGILESVGRGKKKWFTLAKKTVEPEKTSTFDPIIDALPESKPKNELKDVLEIGIVKSSLPVKEDTMKTTARLTDSQGNIIKEVPIETKIKAYPMALNLPPEQRIMEVIDTVYLYAESIQITPESHEIHIKMKG